MGKLNDGEEFRGLRDQGRQGRVQKEGVVI